ncbi:hypothetical protein ACQPZP_02775 [Spirillospora sp. CA-142024]
MPKEPTREELLAESDRVHKQAVADGKSDEEAARLAEEVLPER